MTAVIITTTTNTTTITTITININKNNYYDGGGYDYGYDCEFCDDDNTYFDYAQDDYGDRHYYDYYGGV